MHGACIKEGRRGGAGAAGFIDGVKLHRAGFAIFLQNGEAHGDAEPEDLRGFEAALQAGDAVVGVDEVAIVKGLDADVVELQIREGIERSGDAGEVEFRKTRIEAAHGDAVGDVGDEGFAVRFF